MESAGASGSGVDYPERAARSGRFRFGAPRSFTLLPHREQILFVRSDGPHSAIGDLWRFDVATGTETRVVAVADVLPAQGEEELPAAERARRERLRESGAGITSYSCDQDGRKVCFMLGGRLYLAILGTRAQEPEAAVEELTVPGPVVDPRISPDGKAVAWHAAGRLWTANITDINRIEPLALTPDDGATWGLADFIAAEELNRHHGYWWSPDSTALLVSRVDDREVDQWWLSDPANPEAPAVPQRYPAAGQRNASVSLWLIGPSRTSAQVLAVGPDEEHEYLANVSWSGPEALAQTLTRDQRTTTVHAITADGGARVAARWADEAWVDVVPGTPRWDENGHLVTVRRDAKADRMRVFLGEAAVSPADLQIRSVLGTRGEEIVALTAPTPTTCQVAEIGPMGTHVHTAAESMSVAVGSGGGWHTGFVRGDLRVDLGATLSDEQWRVRARRSDGPRGWIDAGEITSLAEAPGIDPQPELFTVGNIQVAVLLPRDHAPEPGASGGPLPVLMLPYGGPHSQRVMAAGPAFVEAQWWADQGFAVVVADGRGTPGVSPSWERAVLGDLASPAVEDQVTALDAVIARYGQAVDGGRVGIMGWSFGGYLAALAVLRYPQRFRAAIAGAPVTDWRLYDTAYTERYLGLPQDNAEAYDRSSLLPLAGELASPLLLIHGLADDNVVAAHTLRLSAALLAAGRPHQVLPLSQVTHMAGSTDVAANLLRLQLDFFRGHLRSTG